MLVIIDIRNVYIHIANKLDYYFIVLSCLFCLAVTLSQTPYTAEANTGHRVS